MRFEVVERAALVFRAGGGGRMTRFGRWGLNGTVKTKLRVNGG